MKILLITGIPGTGKTTIGDYLKNHHGFVHIDMEDNKTWPAELFDLGGAIDVYFPKIKQKGQDTVITWGFVPDYPGHIDAITNLINGGAKMIWFDGNRLAARKAFLKRGTVSEDALNIQMDRINKADITNLFQPIIIDTFDNDGSFLEKEIIANKLLNL